MNTNKPTTNDEHANHEHANHEPTNGTERPGDRARRRAELHARRLGAMTDAELWNRWERAERKRCAGDETAVNRARRAMLRVEMNARGIGPDADATRTVSVRDAITSDLTDAPGAVYLSTWNGAERVDGIRVDATGVWAVVRTPDPVGGTRSYALHLDKTLLYVPNA